jgi:hypothetical protein
MLETMFRMIFEIKKRYYVDNKKRYPFLPIYNKEKGVKIHTEVILITVFTF